VSDETGCGKLRIALEGVECIFRQHHHRPLATAGDMLGLALQGGFHHLAQLRLGILQAPLFMRHRLHHIWSVNLV